MIFALRKRYLVGGSRVECLEVCDWHTLPGLKGSGLGIRLMRAMMRQPERLIAVGGTADVKKTLPALGWQRLGDAVAFELRVSGDALAEAVERRTGLPRVLTRLPLAAIAAAWLAPRERLAPPGGTVAVTSSVGDHVPSLYEANCGYGFVQEPLAEVLAWTMRTPPANGVFDQLLFTVDGRLRGWSLTRAYEDSTGCEAALLDVFAPRPDVALYTWMVSAAAARLMRWRPRLIRARATCPCLQQALTAVGFRASREPVPIFTWPKGLSNIAPLHITMNHTDEPLRPYALGEGQGRPGATS